MQQNRILHLQFLITNKARPFKFLYVIAFSIENTNHLENDYLGVSGVTELICFQLRNLMVKLRRTETVDIFQQHHRVIYVENLRKTSDSYFTADGQNCNNVLFCPIVYIKFSRGFASLHLNNKLHYEVVGIKKVKQGVRTHFLKILQIQIFPDFGTTF